MLASLLHRWFPWLILVNGQTIKADIIAAFTCAALAIPQGIAFAAIAGLPPEYGFYSALIAPVLAVLFGSSWHMVCGPATAISALLFSTLQGLYLPGSAEFIQAAITLTFLAGLIQLALGLAKMGGLTNFVSHAVMVGFITGAALLIMLSQINNALQINLPRPENLMAFILAIPAEFARLNMAALQIAAVTLASALLVRQIFPKAPHYLLALIAGSAFGYGIDASSQGVMLVGELPNIVPPFASPHLSFELIRQLAPGAVVIALVGLLEAASIARSISLKTGQEIDGNREFIGQGMSNIGGSFFSSYMSSGSFTRSGINIDSGAKTPIAILASAAILFLVLYFIAPMFAHLPIAAMASVIILVGWRLIAFAELSHYAKTNRSEFCIALTTLVFTLGISLEFGLTVGVALSLALFLKQTAKPNVRIMAPLITERGKYFHNIEHFDIASCPQINFIRLDGPIYFGSVEYVSQQFNQIVHSNRNHPHWLLLCRGISNLDMQGAHTLKKLIRSKRKAGGDVHLVIRYFWQVDRFKEFGLLKEIGEDNIYPSKGIAIKELVPKLDKHICQQCPQHIFSECPEAAKVEKLTTGN